MTLTTEPLNPYLDLPTHRGQRVERYRFEWKNGVTDQTLGFLQPSKDDVPTLTHDTGQSIKRRLTISLNDVDTARINPLTDRILPSMTVGEVTYPLGRYMFTDETDRVSTGGDRGAFTLLDEGFIVDQELEKGFTASRSMIHSGATGAILELIRGLPLVAVIIEASPYNAVGSFSAGQTRGQAIAAIEIQGDYFPHWFDHNGAMRMIRTREPANEIPMFDLDAGNKIIRGSIGRTSDVLIAPNKFIVISNTDDAQDAPIVGSYEIPASAPHSIANRGFVIPKIFDIQVASVQQANAAARNYGIRRTTFERVTFETANDPRHDSYDVLHFDGANWLELSWSMNLVAGGRMQHLIRRAYL